MSITADELEKAADDLEAELETAPTPTDFETVLLLTSVQILVRSVIFTYRAAAEEIRRLERQCNQHDQGLN